MENKEVQKPKLKIKDTIRKFIRHEILGVRTGPNEILTVEVGDIPLIAIYYGVPAAAIILTLLNAPKN